MFSTRRIWIVPLVAMMLSTLIAFAFIAVSPKTTVMSSLGAIWGVGAGGCGTDTHAHGGLKNYKVCSEEAGGHVKNYHKDNFQKDGVCFHKFHFTGSNSFYTERCDQNT